jgi:hypothetical protein
MKKKKLLLNGHHRLKVMQEIKKENRGGARENAGRKKGEETIVIRIPLSTLPDVLELINKLKSPKI